MFNEMDRIRWVKLFPYLKGKGPSFSLKLYETNKTMTGPGTFLRECVGYKFSMCERGKTTVLFEGDDFLPSPMDTIDGDNCVRALLGFITLKPGDTDKEWFKEYTKKQLEFCDHHAESVLLETISRFGEF